MVLVGHQYGMLGNEPLVVPIVNFPLDAVGAIIFFFVSGYLISASILRGASPGYYIASRMLRIYPGLLVALVACIALGLAIGRLPPGAFLADPATGRFVLGNLFPFFQDQPIALPGVFETAHWGAVNGSLWTLKYELLCYLMFFAVCLLQRGRRMAMACVVVAFVIYAYLTFPKLSQPPPEVHLIRVTLYSFIIYTFCFCLGSAMAILSTTRWFDFRLAIAAAAVLVFAFRETDIGQACNLLLIGTLSLGLARLYLPVLSKIDHVGDVSYGVYLYNYPVGNFAATYLSDLLPAWGVFAFTLTVTFAAAFLSWKLVEGPALALRRRLRPAAMRAQPAAEPAEALKAIA